MAKMTVSLHYPPQIADAPVIYQLVRSFNISFSILRAEVAPDKRGRLTLALTGDSDALQRGIDFLKQQNITVRVLKHNVIWNRERCVDCGACTAVCPSKALSLDADAKLNFNPELCIACEQCLRACPLRAMDVDLFDSDGAADAR